MDTLQLVNILLLSVRRALLLAACLAGPALADSLPAATLAEAQAVFGRAATAAAPESARVEVVPGELDSRLRLAPCNRIEAYLPSGTRPWGASRVGLRCVDGPKAWNVSLPVTVKVFAPALVATQPLQAGSTIEASHLTTAVVDWAAERSPVLLRAERLLGRVLARPLSVGEALRSADLRPRQWFAAGDIVQIVAKGNGFSISAEGQAISAGIEGHPARVRTDSGRIVSGEPRGERRIELAL
jgi:flagellar basal body P-ring formation protein FlgA